MTVMGTPERVRSFFNPHAEHWTEPMYPSTGYAGRPAPNPAGFSRRVDHGQVVEYTEDDPVQTAKNGVLRVGSHGRYGYGEFRLRPVSDNRVSGRINADKVGDD